MMGTVIKFPLKKSDPFDDKLSRIKASLEKINRLMAELKIQGEKYNVDNSKN